MMKRTFFFFLVLVLEGLVGLRITMQFQFFSISFWGINLHYCDVEWFALEMNQSLSFLRLPPMYCILDSFVDCEGYSMSTKGFLPTVVDVMVI